MYRVGDTQPVNVAAHLRLLGKLHYNSSQAELGMRDKRDTILSANSRRVSHAKHVVETLFLFRGADIFHIFACSRFLITSESVLRSRSIFDRLRLRGFFSPAAAPTPAPAPAPAPAPIKKKAFSY